MFDCFFKTEVIYTRLGEMRQPQIQHKRLLPIVSQLGGLPVYTYKIKSLIMLFIDYNECLSKAFEAI